LINVEILNKIKNSNRIAFIGNGGNLAIAQHGASDMSRHLDKHCFAPDSVHLTALGGDDSWHKQWVKEYAKHADLLIGITTRIDSPISESLQEFKSSISISPVLIPNTLNHLIKEKTYHEFEVKALLSIYQMIEGCGVILPKIK